MRKSKKKFRSHRHLFLFKIPDLLRPGKTKVIKSWAKVINATSPVELKLKAEDVQRSMQMDGIGNTQTCSMAICANRQADSFKHPVEGYIDWQYSRAYVVTKLNKDGLPCECVCYGHWDDVARVNDSKGGQKQLLADLRLARLRRSTKSQLQKTNLPSVARLRRFVYVAPIFALPSLSSAVFRDHRSHRQMPYVHSYGIC
jgi:hypothetical protein